jgi:cell division protein ZapE
VTPSDFLYTYEQCVTQGKINNDPAQREVSQHLQALYEALSPKPDSGIIRKFISSRQGTAPRGIYLWGDVGRGKSMLMDMFYKSVPAKAKQRLHFYSLMLGIHKDVHATRQKNIDDPVKYVATELAQKTKLLCLDEFQVTDVADAMILDKLFTTLIDKNVTICITSNRPPEELYKGGLQREKFLDFVKLLYERMDVIELTSQHDYRTEKIKSLKSVYLSPLNKKNESALQEIFADLTDNQEPHETVLEVQGRKLPVSKMLENIAQFTFAELCEKPLGPADYLAICQRFKTVLISGIPALSPEKRNEARRFVALIDSLYDNHVKFICTAAVPPEDLYPKGDGTFEFHRTVSRLIEMQSEQYLSA